MTIPSTFNPEAFASGSFEGQADDRYLRIHPKEYRARIVGPFGENKKTRLRIEKEYLILDVVWQPEDEEQRQMLNVEKLPTVRQSIFLETTPQGGLDMGEFKNGDLGRLQKAVGVPAQEGDTWRFQDFIGKPARIKVEHKPNPSDSQNPYQNVTAVTSIY